jgi:hypothetical protein
VLRVIVGVERGRVTEQCMVRSVMVGTVRVSSWKGRRGTGGC